MTTVFDSKILQKINHQVQGSTPEEKVQSVLNLLHHYYPEYIDKHIKSKWVFTNATWNSGCILVLFASWTEYLIIASTPLISSGYTGMYLTSTINSYVFNGRIRNYVRNSSDLYPKINTYTQGDVFTINPGASYNEAHDENTCWIEHGIGCILSIVPSFVVATLLSTLNPLVPLDIIIEMIKHFHPCL